MEDIIWSTGEIDESRLRFRQRANWVWTQLVDRSIKVNVDGSYLGSFRRGGIGDSRGKILLQFRNKARVDLVVHVELLAL